MYLRLLNIMCEDTCRKFVIFGRLGSLFGLFLRPCAYLDRGGGLGTAKNHDGVALFTKKGSQIEVLWGSFWNTFRQKRVSEETKCFLCIPGVTYRPPGMAKVAEV